jgi:hypothetical protein
MDTETGCIARANPYDVTLEEHSKAHVGWYIWELMITKRWGDVHGVFYPDGTVRDPAIPAAMFGLFRNRSDNAILENRQPGGLGQCRHRRRAGVAGQPRRQLERRTQCRGKTRQSAGGRRN